MSIMCEARSFDVMRRKLRADVTINFRFPDDQKKYRKFGIMQDEHVMKDRSMPMYCAGSAQPKVDLMISPTVVRCGNSEGVGYDQEHCLIPMDVLCDISIPAQQEPVCLPDKLMGRGQSRQQDPTHDSTGEVDAEEAAAADDQYTMDEPEPTRSTMGGSNSSTGACKVNLNTFPTTADEGHGSNGTLPGRATRSSKRISKTRTARPRDDEGQDELAGDANYQPDSDASTST